MDINHSGYDGTSRYFLEKYWNKDYFLIWMDRYWTSCIWIGIIYIVLIFLGQYLMKNKTPYNLRGCLFFWNAFLAIFSILGTIRMFPELYFSLMNYGFEYTICSDSFYDGHSGIWGALFAISKVFEMIDTLFIVLRKSPLIFLHWYHHVVTLWVCWYAVVTHLALGRWYAVMNYIVHSIMYSYYALKSLRFRVPRFVNVAITTCQIVQMLLGIYVTFTAFILFNSGYRCHANNGCLLASLAMYFSFTALFAKFFAVTYLSKYKKISKKI